jgi:hypothetical protein
MVRVAMGEKDELQVYALFIDHLQNLSRIPSRIDKKPRALIIPYQVTVGPQGPQGQSLQEH